MIKEILIMIVILFGIISLSAGEMPSKTRIDGRFIAYDNGTVLDTKSGLMWAARDNGMDIEWLDAKSYCEHYQGGGHTGWRMPTQDELAELYDKDKTYKSSCGDDVHITELIRLTCSWIWVSSRRDSKAADFNFSNGGKSWHNATHTYPYRVLPVRFDHLAP